MKEVLETVVETPYESYESFLDRRSHSMACMIGSLQARLEMLDIELDISIQYASNGMLEQAKQYMKDMRKDVLKTLIEFQTRWAEMQDYKEEYYMYEISNKKIDEYSNKLNDLK